MKRIVKKIIPISLKQVYRKYISNPHRSAFYRKTTKEIFTQIFETNHWQGGQSVSGTGSDQAQVQTVISEVNSLIEEFEIKSILDLPCGDFNWMKSVNLDGVHYLGADIVDILIESNSKTYSSNNIKFKVLDLISDPLPKSELMICRDCIVHLSFENIYTSLQNIKSSGCKYLLTTSFVTHNLNYEICTGDWRTINLQLNPFNFPDPIKIINENCTEGSGEYSDKSLALYLIKDIKLPPTMYKTH